MGIRSTTQLTLFDPTGGDYGESERSTVGGRRSTRRHNVSYAENTPSRVPEPNPVQKGGRIALWWLQLLKQKQQEQERIDAEEDDDEKNLAVTMTEGQFDDADEIEGEEEITKADDDDEDFTMSKDGDHESTEEESLKNVEKERAGTLSPFLEPQNDDDEMEEEDEEEEEEEVDEEHAIV